MRNAVLIASLGFAIVAGGAIAAGGQYGDRQHGPRHSFEELDANGDGKLMPEEMATHMQARFAGADANGDGALSKDELVAGINKERAERVAKYVDQMIERHDANDDGALTMEEMRSDRHEKMFARMDADDDGAVSKEEFEQMQSWRKHHKQKGHGHGHGKWAPDAGE